MSLFGKLSEQINGIAINDTRDSSNSLNSMEYLFNFLQNSSLFEEAILMIVKLELESLTRLHSIYSIEQTASFKLVTEIMKLLSSLSSNCTKVPQIVNFTSSVITTILSYHSKFSQD